MIVPQSPIEAMSEENAFRIVLAVVFAAMLVVWARNLLRVGVTRDVFYGPAEGLLVAIPIRVLVALSLLGIVAYLVDPGWMSWSSASLPAGVRWPGLPLGLGDVEGVRHDYVRHGTVTLFAAHDVASGRVPTQCKRRHRQQEFLQFLRPIEASVAEEARRSSHRGPLHDPQARDRPSLARSPPPLPRAHPQRPERITCLSAGIYVVWTAFLSAKICTISA